MKQVECKMLSGRWGRAGHKKVGKGTPDTDGEKTGQKLQCEYMLTVIFRRSNIINGFIEKKKH